MKKLLLIILISVSIFLLLGGTVTNQYSSNEEDTEHLIALASLKDYYKPNLIQPEILTRLDVNQYSLLNRGVLIDAYSEEVSPNISRVIIDEAYANDIPINLFFAIASVESNFRRFAVNHNDSSSDFGLFQLNDSYRQNWSQSEFFNIYLNTAEAALFFKEMYNQTGTYEDAVRAYNAGPYRVINDMVPESTQRYIIRVLEEEHRFDIILDDYLSSQSIVLNN